jgi:carbohydrate binding protein with CBM4/9 domain
MTNKGVNIMKEAFKSFGKFRNITILISLTLSSLLLSSQLSADDAVVNLLTNPGAETQIPAGKFISEINFKYMMSNDFIDFSDNVPEGWGAYVNAETKVKWGQTDKEFHSGKYSCFMTLVDSLKSGASHYDCIVLSKTNGSNGEKTIKVEPGATYKYSFWIKGDMGKVTIRLFTWNTDDAKKMKWKGLKYGVSVTKEWTEIKGVITPVGAVKKFAIGIDIGNAKAGQSLYIDDAVISKASATPVK